MPPPAVAKGWLICRRSARQPTHTRFRWIWVANCDHQQFAAGKSLMMVSLSAPRPCSVIRFPLAHGAWNSGPKMARVTSFDSTSGTGPISIASGPSKNRSSLGSSHGVGGGRPSINDSTQRITSARHLRNFHRHPPMGSLIPQAAEVGENHDFVFRCWESLPKLCCVVSPSRVRSPPIHHSVTPPD